MVFKAADRVQEISATVGTGPFVTTGAPTGFQTWLAGLGNGNSAYYAAYLDAQWEIGETVLSGGNTLSRTVLASSNANALVDFPAGAKKVFLDYPAVRAVFVTPTGKLNVGLDALSSTMVQFNNALTDGDFVFQLGSASLGYIYTGAGVVDGQPSSIELGQLRTGNGDAHIDFHSAAGTDFETRILRSAGANGDFVMSNTGNGAWYMNNAGTGYMYLMTQSSARITIASGGEVGIGANPYGGFNLNIGPAVRIEGGAGGAQIHMNGGASQGKQIVALTNSSYRWIYGSSANPESGGNYGSDFFINRYADDGNFLQTSLMINRGSGDTTLGNNLTVVGPNVWTGNGYALFQGVASGCYIRSYASSTMWLGYDSTNALQLNPSGLTLNTGQFIGTEPGGNQILLKAGSSNTPTLIQRCDGANFYFLLSDPSIYAVGTWNALRPFSINLYNGNTAIANGLTVNGMLTANGGMQVNGTTNLANYINMFDPENDYDMNIRFLANDIATYRGIIGFQGTTDLRLWANTGWVRSVSNFVCPYIQSDGGGGFAGIVSASSTGLSAGFRAVNNNVGHDYRFIAKDAGPCAITNESLAVEYMNFDHAGNINVSRPLSVTGAATFHGVNTFPTYCRANSGGAIVWANAWSALECYNVDTSGGGAALMKFHRPGQFGVYYGLEPDNAIRLGGWSAGILTTVDASGNFTAAGNVAAYSDERIKKNWRPVCDDYVSKLAEVKNGIFDRTDVELTQVGCSAQSLQKVLPEAVGEENSLLNVNYGGAAMLSVIELAKEVVMLRDKIAMLEEKLNAH